MAAFSFDQLEIPIIQGPMLGVSNAGMVAAVSNAGGLGSLAASNLPADKMREAIAMIRQGTTCPFLVNIFVLDPAEPNPAEIRAAMERLAPWRARYGLPSQSIPNIWAESFADQF